MAKLLYDWATLEEEIEDTPKDADEILLQRSILINEVKLLKENQFFQSDFKLLLELEPETINNLEYLAKKLQCSKGRILNNLMKAGYGSTNKTRDFLKEFDSSIKISNVDQLLITKNDLLQTGKMLKLVHIEHLIFNKDVDLELFQKYIHKIVNVPLIEFLNQEFNSQKLVIFSRIQQSNEIVFYG